MREPALGHQVGVQRAHPGSKGLLGSRGLQQRVPFPADADDLIAEDGRLQVEPGGEVPVEGADADSGAPGDVFERRVGTLFRERLRGGGDQPDMVLPRVGSLLLGGSLLLRGTLLGGTLLGGSLWYLVRCSRHRFETNTGSED